MKWGTTKDVAARYLVHEKTVKKWAKAGIIPVSRINARCVRYDLDACDAILKQRTQEPGDN